MAEPARHLTTSELPSIEEIFRKESNFLDKVGQEIQLQDCEGQMSNHIVRHGLSGEEDRRSHELESP